MTSRSSRSPLRRLVVLLAGLALVLGACGDDGGGNLSLDDEPATPAQDGGGQGGNGDPTDPADTPDEPDPADGQPILAEAVDSTLAVETMAFTMRADFTGLPGVDQGTLTAEGAFDRASERATVTMDLSEFTAGLGVPGGADVFDGPLELIIDGDTAYMRGIPLLAPGDRWIKMDQGTAEGFSAGVTDPTAGLEALRDVSEDFTEAGTGEVDGDPVTFYEGTIDYAAVSEDLDPDQTEALEEVFGDLGAGVDDLPPVDYRIAVDDQDRVRQMVIEADLAGVDLGVGGSAADGASYRVEMTMTDLDEPVDIQIPGPDEVTEFDLDSFGIDPEQFQPTD